MNRIIGFAPVIGARPRVLILGSMPSVASLEKHQYYGKPQNAFWRIMGELFGAGPGLAYAERTTLLAQKGVAVWDVLASCERPGSLDSAIKMQTAEVNGFSKLLVGHPGIAHVFFNGKKAEEIFHKRSLVAVDSVRPDLKYTALPSTSPAMASLNFTEKLDRWKVVARAALV
jgi:TDG/mug DNA glycosylase family protein